MFSYLPETSSHSTHHLYDFFLGFAHYTFFQFTSDLFFSSETSRWQSRWKYRHTVPHSSKTLLPHLCSLWQKFHKSRRDLALWTAWGLRCSQPCGSLSLSRPNRPYSQLELCFSNSSLTNRSNSESFLCFPLQPKSFFSHRLSTQQCILGCCGNNQIGRSEIFPSQQCP